MDTIQQNKALFIFEGISFIILGILAIAVPAFFTLGFELFIGWLFIFTSFVQAYRLIKLHRILPGFTAALITTIIYFIAGLLLLAYPVQGIITLTVLLIIYFLLEGIAKIGWGFELRPLKGSGWLITSGIISLIMAAIIIAGWPTTAFWVLGLLIGINMLFFGSSLIALAWSAPKV